jgi:hypothetical protein
MKNKLYNHLKNNDILVEHKCQRAFCDTFGIHYEYKEPPKVGKSKSKTAMESFSKIKKYYRIRKILE